MCMNCGCGEINERHGNQANIVAEDVRRAADASGQDLQTTAQNLQSSLREMSASGIGSSSMGSSSVGSSSTGSGSSGQDASNR